MAHMTPGKKKPPRSVREWMREIGRTGGLAKSAAKTAAVRQNARKPRTKKEAA